LVKQIESLNSIRPVAYDPIADFLNNGMLYFNKRDRNFRPICILDVKKFLATEFTDEELTNLIVYLFDYVIDN